MRIANLLFFFLSCCPVEAWTSAVDTASVVLKDHSEAAISLFNNMRTPAALIGGSLVPLGILSAPKVEKGDSKTIIFMKKANILLGVTSLLSEVIAVTYSSIAINKLVEVKSPLTKGCAELIANSYELAWIGTNIHFLLGLLGFGLIVGSKAYLSNSADIGRVTIGWSIAAFLQALSIVNKGIAMGQGSSDRSWRFATNFFTLNIRYLALIVQSTKRGFFSVGAIAVGIYALFETIKVLLPERNNDDN